MSSPDRELVEFVRANGLADDDARWTPLSGGVSSDIWRVESPAGAVCIKRALAQLKTAAEWKAPVDRNTYEWLYMLEADRIVPGSVPRPIAQDAAAGLFAMQWLPPDTHRLWKSELLAGRVDPEFAGETGTLLGRIHAATADNPETTARFNSDANFHALRIEPYLLATARVHPDLADRLESIAAATAATHRALVHGDVSPKNILIGPAGPVLLDAECAWFGDPAFDLAFCLTHLAVKARVVAGAGRRLANAFQRFVSAYLDCVNWETPGEVEARAARLLPALVLARVDGKSPLEYLQDRDRIALRSVARNALINEPRSLHKAAEELLS